MMPFMGKIYYMKEIQRMKKLLAMLLAVACVVCLFAGCGAETPTAQKTTTSAKPTEPTNPSTPAPTDPTDPEIPTLPGAPVGGDKVHIFMPSNGLAIGYTAEGSKLAGVSGTVTDGVLTAEGAGVYEVIVDSEGR